MLVSVYRTELTLPPAGPDDGQKQFFTGLESPVPGAARPAAL